MEKPVFTIVLGGLFVGVSMTDIHDGLKIVALLVPICYTAWRWFRDWKKTKKK